MAYHCPRCGHPIKRSSSHAAAIIGGMVGSMIASAFGPFECQDCGTISTSEFPPDVQKQITMGSIGLVAGALALAATVLSLLIYVFAKDSSNIPASPPKVYTTSGKFKPAVESKKLPGLYWTADFEGALAEAEKSRNLVFINFTAATCTNCKLNEHDIFPQEKVKALLGRYVLVELHTFAVPEILYVHLPTEEQRQEDAQANLEFQKREFETADLPFYVIVRPAGGGRFNLVDVYGEGRINNVATFIEFLRKPFK